MSDHCHVEPSCESESTPSDASSCNHEHHPTEEPEVLDGCCHTGQGLSVHYPDKPENAAYHCPMCPGVFSEEPGDCPMCGMALEPIGGSPLGDEDPELQQWKQRCIWAVVLTLPVFVLGMGEHGWALVNQWFAEDAATSPAHDRFPMWTAWLQGALTLVVLAGPARILLKRFWTSLQSLHLNMFTLVGIGILSALVYSVAALIVPEWFPASVQRADGTVPVFFESAAVIATVVIIGQWLETRARGQTRTALKKLMEQAPSEATRIREGQDEVVSIDAVNAGDVLRVRPGESVPLDGEIQTGQVTVDESMMTGESMPVSKQPGNSVIGGTVLTEGTMTMVVTATGEDTVLSNIVMRVREAQQTRPPIQFAVDQVAAVFVPIVLLLAVAAAVYWGAIHTPHEPQLAWLTAVSVLLIACPCALGLATPVSFTVATGEAAQQGILITNAEALETLSRVDTLVFDKTGTLTQGKPQWVDGKTWMEWSLDACLQCVASLERASEHPLGQALIAEAKHRGLTLSEAEDIQVEVGNGIAGTIEGKRLWVGRLPWIQEQLQEHGNSIPKDTVTEMSTWQVQFQEQGHTAITVVATTLSGVSDATLQCAMVAVGDPLKPTTESALRELKDKGLRLLMVTGDGERTAQAVAKQVGITEVKADQSPEDKYQLLKQLQYDGACVAMAGDGVNDAAGLAQADVGLAMGHGTDIAKSTAHITLVQGDLNAIERAFALSNATLTNVRQNLGFAFIYNVLGIPIAAGVLYPAFGLLLHPMVASIAMSLSSVCVITNALRLKTHPWIKQGQ